jgi:hypothetical protein
MRRPRGLFKIGKLSTSELTDCQEKWLRAAQEASDEGKKDTEVSKALSAGEFDVGGKPLYA